MKNRLFTSNLLNSLTTRQIHLKSPLSLNFSPNGIAFPSFLSFICFLPYLLKLCLEMMFALLNSHEIINYFSIFFLVFYLLKHIFTYIFSHTW